MNLFTCQRWDSDLPNEHDFNELGTIFADGSIPAASNYCRNPLRVPYGAG